MNSSLMMSPDLVQYNLSQYTSVVNFYLQRVGKRLLTKEEEFIIFDFVKNNIKRDNLREGWDLNSEIYLLVIEKMFEIHPDIGVILEGMCARREQTNLNKLDR